MNSLVPFINPHKQNQLSLNIKSNVQLLIVVFPFVTALIILASIFKGEIASLLIATTVLLLAILVNGKGGLRWLLMLSATIRFLLIYADYFFRDAALITNDAAVPGA